MGFFSGCARLLLITFNFVFWLSGAAILGVGIWILVDPNIKDYLDIIKDASNDESLKTSAYILIGFGAFVFLVGFCGCCGAIRSSKCLLGFYIFFLVIVCAGELAAGIFVAVFKNDIINKLNTGLRDSIKERYEQLATAWDSVQTELKCCGGNNYTDYENSAWRNHSTNPGEVIPKSCCTQNDTNQPENYEGCQKLVGGTYYQQGCRAALEDWINSHSAILIGVGCGIAALEIIGLICAILFCRNIDREKYNSN